MNLVLFTGTLPQLCWFDGLSRSKKEQIKAALASGQYKLYWDELALKGVLIKI